MTPDPPTSNSASRPSSHERVGRKWSNARAGEHYRTDRWGSKRRRERDPARIDALLGRCLAAGSERPARILDVPCGTGRLQPRLSERGWYVGLDVSPTMLGAFPPGARTRVRGTLERLPFAADSFEVVVCCRLFHHFERVSDLQPLIAELLRVSNGHVVASFWDAAAWPAWHRRHFGSGRATRRHCHSKGSLEAAFESAGAEILGYRHSLRFFSRQTFLLARKR